MTDLATIKITVDASTSEWLSEITRCLSLLNEIVPRLVEIVEIFDNLPERGSSLFIRKSFRAARTNEHVIVLEPCQGLRDLVAAMRAREGLGEFVAELGHGGTPTGLKPSSLAPDDAENSPAEVSPS